MNRQLTKEQEIAQNEVHKQIKQLLEENIIEKEGTKYKLNINWIKKEKDYYEYLEDKYSKKMKSQHIDQNFKEPINLKFDSLGEVSVFCANLTIDKKIVGNGDHTIVVWLRHLFIPFNLNFSDYSLLKKMVKSNGRVLVISPEKSPLDFWVKEQYLKAGFEQVKLGVAKDLFDEGFFIHGDSIAEITSSEKTKKIIDKIYNRNHNLGDLFKEIFFRKEAKQKMEFNLKISKNPKLAKIIRKQLLEYFE